MIDWAARAKAELASNPDEAPDRTDESPVTSVSSAPTAAVGLNEFAQVAVSSVSSVHPPHVTANDDVGPCDATKPARRSGNPYMTPEQGDKCHQGGWDDAEIDAFTAREAWFTQMGRLADAEHLAERLTLRDRQHDDRRLCLECSWLGDTGRCRAAATGRIPGADRRHEPAQANLQQCRAFGLRKGLL